MKLLVTGGAGFIGSAFIRSSLDSAAKIMNLDKLTYAGNLANLASIDGDARYQFVHGDVCDQDLVNQIFREERPDAVIHFAAESHVDRSLLAAAPVFETNLRGAFVLLEAARVHGVGRFVHVSTDEVYGSIDEPLEADESFPLRPSSPYSASKAGSDLLALSYFNSYKVPVVVTRAANNYGPYQFPEKLIPLMIANALADRPLPLYGDGLHMRDWLHVDDHCRALRAVMLNGRIGETYNISGNCRLNNREVIKRILRAVGKSEDLIQPVRDRPAHDRRYAMSCAKITTELGWKPSVSFEAGLADTIQWYCDNAEWTNEVCSGEYQAYYAQQYLNRV